MGQVRVRPTKGSEIQVWVGKLDTKLFHERVNKLELGLTLPSGMTPHASFLSSAMIHWSNTTQLVIVQYMMLIEDFNAGLIPLDEYAERRKRIDTALLVLMELKPELLMELSKLNRTMSNPTEKTKQNVTILLEKARKTVK